MNELTSRQRQAKLLRGFRKIHRMTGIICVGFFAVLAISKGLEGWKKHSSGLILAENVTGTTTDLMEWLPCE